MFNLGNLILETAFLPSSENNSVKGFLKIKGNSKLDRSTFLSIDTTLISDTSFLGKYGYDDRDRFFKYY